MRNFKILQENSELKKEIIDLKQEYSKIKSEYFECFYSKRVHELNYSIKNQDHFNEITKLQNEIHELKEKIKKTETDKIKLKTNSLYGLMSDTPFSNCYSVTDTDSVKTVDEAFKSLEKKLTIIDKKISSIPKEIHTDNPTFLSKETVKIILDFYRLSMYNYHIDNDAYKIHIKMSNICNQLRQHQERFD